MADLFDFDFRQRFDGAEYRQEHDQPRLTKQIARIFTLMKDAHWRTLAEISDLTGDADASVSAQLRNLRKERFGAHTVERRARGSRERGLFEYRLLITPPGV